MNFHSFASHTSQSKSCVFFVNINSGNEIVKKPIGFQLIDIMFTQCAYFKEMNIHCQYLKVSSEDRDIK